MISWSNVLQALGYFILVLTLALAGTTLFAFAGQDNGLTPLALSTAITGVLALLLIFSAEASAHEFNHREGLFLVVIIWIGAGVLGALPFYFSDYFSSFTDAAFESISGFTTTGASILSDVEALPDSLLFWRALTHWLGGMGIILLMIAILPLIGAGGMELYRAEFSGARSEKLKPRVAEAAVALWKIYVGLSVGEYVALRFAGLDPFDAICHTFATVATGGFSTRNQSVESFHNPTAELVITAFMIASGINFTQHYRVWMEKRPTAFWKDPEVRFYLLLLAAASVVMTLTVYNSTSAPLIDAARLAVFNTVSIMTTTGFSSADFGQWVPFAQLLLLALMFAGGCTGSTSGGFKSARMVLLGKVVAREFRRMVERRGIFAIHFSDQAVSESAIQSLLNLVYLAFMVNFAACLLLTSVGVDIVSAISGVAATMFGVGPGLGEVGPAKNYAHLPDLAKWTLSFCMIAGRLEFYTLLVLFTRAFWRK